MKEYIIDSCVLVAFLFGEESFSKIQKILDQAFAGEIKLIVSPIILGEIYFISCRKIPKKEVVGFLESLKQNYNLEISSISLEDCMIASEYKTAGGIAYFDCFNLALTKKYPNAEILTLDKEYKKFEDRFKINFL
jgi:predicted nucleic acid-binding protein